MVTLRRVQQIAKEFKEGNRDSFDRAEGSGRPSTSTSDENVERVRLIIENDCRLRCTAIANVTGIPARSVNRILSKNLGKRCLNSRWVPHCLSDDNMESRVDCCQNLKETLERRLIAKRLVVIDEKWIYLRSVLRISR